MEQVKEKEGIQRRRLVILLGLLAVLAMISYTQLSFFVVQPIGAVPEGRTLVLLRTGNLQFVDSADAVCERQMGGVSLLCRGAVLGTIGKEGRILARLPYSETLYTISTGGKKYER